ncbi:MAG: DUF5780 domain-containing protein [Clostridia bacterium]|nr:DUF5780 domain-containing protein [Clostridia bacterium]
MIISIIIIFSIASVGIIKYLNNPLNQFINNIRNDNITKLGDNYNSITKYNDRKKANKYFQKYISDIIYLYIDNINNYEETKEIINRFEKINGLSTFIKDASKNLEDVKLSKEAFDTATKFELENNVLDAMIEYKKVTTIDSKNYEYAQKFISTNMNSLKEKTLNDIDSLVLSNDYISAKELITKLIEIFSNDQNIMKKSEEILNKAKEQEIKKYKNEQEIEVVSASIAIQSDKYKSLYPDMMVAIIKNNSNKTIKNYTVSILAYDINNYPLKIKESFSFSDAKYEFIGIGENENILPGATSKDNKGWKLDENHNISKIVAIVKSADYYDGTSWENPYYQYWIEMYKEKQLQ